MEIGQRKILPLACILLLHASSLFAFSVFGYTYSIQNTTNADLTVNINLAGTSSSSFDIAPHTTQEKRHNYCAYTITAIVKNGELSGQQATYRTGSPICHTIQLQASMVGKGLLLKLINAS